MATNSTPDSKHGARSGDPATAIGQSEARRRTTIKTDEQIDEAIEESFPASDPPSYAVPISPARTTTEAKPRKGER